MKTQRNVGRIGQMGRITLALAALALAAAAQQPLQPRLNRAERVGMFVGGAPLTPQDLKISAAQRAAQSNPAALHWHALSAAEQAQLFQALEKPAEIQSTAALSAALKGGAKLPCVWPTPMTCPGCDGKRMVRAETSGTVRTSIGACPDCKSTGKMSVELARLLVW